MKFQQAIESINKPMMAKIVSIVSISILAVSCSNSASNIDSPELLPADSIKQGDGLFSGSNGGFIFSRDTKPKTVALTETKPSSSPLKDKNLEQTSQILEEKIKQSERNTLELELLKKQIDEKLKSN